MLVGGSSFCLSTTLTTGWLVSILAFVFFFVGVPMYPIVGQGNSQGVDRKFLFQEVLSSQVLKGSAVRDIDDQAHQY
jgi:hypothetical protein